jgi:hypothetical protein
MHLVSGISKALSSVYLDECHDRPHHSTDHHISYTHTCPNTHKHYKPSCWDIDPASHLPHDKPLLPTPPHPVSLLTSSVSPIACGHSMSSCAASLDLPTPKVSWKMKAAGYCMGVGRCVQAWGCRFARRGSCLVRVRGDAVLFGFVGLTSREPHGHSKHFLRVSWAVTLRPWESLGLAST